MLKRVKRWYGDFWYWAFRVVYTSGHLITFLLLPSRRVNPEGKDVVLVCGVEYEDRYSASKIDAFARRCHERFPGTTVVLLSKLDDGVERGQGRAVVTVPWEYQTRARLCSSFLGRFYRPSTFDPEVIRRYASRARFMVDLGDRQLDSRKTTGWTANALTNLVFAKAFGLPFYWYPQTVGPLFGFWGWPLVLTSVLNRMTRTIPTWAEAFCVREEAGLKAFQAHSRAKAVRCLDYLLYAADPQGAVGWSTAPTTLAVVPGDSTGDAQAFRDLLAGLRSRNRGRFQRFVVCSWDETPEWDERRSIALSLEWEVLESGTFRTPEAFLSTSQDVLTVAGTWGALVELVVAGRPAITLGDDPAIEQLCRDFEVEFLRVEAQGPDGPDQLSLAIDRVLAGPSQLSKKVLARRSALLEAYPLPTPV